MFRPLAFLLTALWLLTSGCATTTAPDAPSCATPRSATDSFLAWQQPGSYDLQKAATCVDPAARKEAGRRVQQLKAVLDAKGLIVPVATLPDDPDHLNEDGQAVVEPLGEAFPLVVAKTADGTWRITAGTLAAVPQHYAATFSPWSLWLQQQLPPVFFRDLLGFQPWQALFAGLLGLLALLTARAVRFVLRDQAIRLVRRFDLHLNLELYARTNGPLSVLAVAFVLAWGVPQLRLPVELSAGLLTLLVVVERAAGTLVALRGVDVLGDLGMRWAEKSESKLDDQLVPLLMQAAKALLVGFGAFLVLDALGVDVWKLAAGVGIGGVALAFGAQDTVANVFGSLNIFLDRPFQIGDWIVVNGVEGVVEEVGFRSTRVRTFYNSQVTIPNSQITNANVDNYGRRNRRRVKLTLSLTYDTPPEKLAAYVEGVRAILAAHPYVERTYEVHFYDLGASSLDILVYYHVVVPGWHEELTTRAQNLVEFMRLAKELGVAFAFPSTSLYLETTPDQPLPDPATASTEELTQLVEAFGPEGKLSQPDGVVLGVDYSAQSLPGEG